MCCGSLFLRFVIYFSSKLIFFLFYFVGYTSFVLIHIIHIYLYIYLFCQPYGEVDINFPNKFKDELGKVWILVDVT